MKLLNLLSLINKMIKLNPLIMSKHNKLIGLINKIINTLINNKLSSQAIFKKNHLLDLIQKHGNYLKENKFNLENIKDNHTFK